MASKGKTFRITSETTETEAGLPSSRVVKPHDWNLCLLCQDDNEEQLQCPADSKRSNIGAGYVTLSENLIKFNEIGCLPKSVNLNALDDGTGIANTLVQNHAKYHKSCYLRYNSTMLKRVQKQQLDEEDKQ